MRIEPYTSQKVSISSRAQKSEKLRRVRLTPHKDVYNNSKINVVSDIVWVKANTTKVTVENLSNSPVLLQENSDLCIGTPMPEATIEVDSSLNEPAIEREQTPRQTEQIEFAEQIRRYDEFPELKKLLIEFKSVFIRDDEFKLNVINVTPLRIPLKSPEGRVLPTPQFRGRNYKPQDISDIDAFIKDSLESGLIEESKSAVQNPLHLVRTKKYDENGSLIGVKTRVTHDCRKNNELNAQEINYAFPVIDEELNELTSINAEYFSSVDMKSGFNQVPVDEHFRQLFSFPVYDGAYKGRNFQYTRLIFGWRTSPALFSDVLAKIFYKLEHENCRLSRYIDDTA